MSHLRMGPCVCVAVPIRHVWYSQWQKVYSSMCWILFTNMNETYVNHIMIVGIEELITSYLWKLEEFWKLEYEH